MSKTFVNREANSPQFPQERDAVLRELQSVIESPYFCNSKRYPALLRYIVENALAGNSDRLKERTLGIEVFDRAPTYDTNADTVVRYTAGEVRKRLLLYYSEHRSEHRIRISLPAGSYVPEFLPENDADSTSSSAAMSEEQRSGTSNLAANQADRIVASSAIEVLPPASAPERPAAEIHPPRQVSSWLRIGLTAAALLCIVGVLIALGFRSHLASGDDIVSDFWAPVLHKQAVINVCTGGVVFQNNNYSGVITADKNSEYPFVSMQAASAISQVSAFIDHAGASARLLPAPTTAVSDLREHPIVLVGAYNNRWTMRLLQSARYQFTPEPVESIIDTKQPQFSWLRDHTRPYSGSDDYAVIARIRDSVTDQWVIVLGGLGRNGTEAAAFFATNPNGMRMLQERLGFSFASGKNIEAVLRVRVIDGKTGAPSIEAVYAW
jgi:hypothetical protein